MIGGDIKEITYSHPVLGNGVWFTKSGEDNTLDPGGYRGNDDNNGVDSGGRTIRTLNLSRWSLATTIAWDMTSSKELDQIKKLAAHPIEATYTISFVNGAVYAGTGAPVGDVAGNGNAATTALKLAGGGECEQIA